MERSSWSDARREARSSFWGADPRDIGFVPDQLLTRQGMLPLCGGVLR
jgi:hypothetical protein